jgi:hypothetical protein
MTLDPNVEETQSTQATNQKQRKQNNRRSTNATQNNDMAMDDLTSTMKNVSLVPSSIRFGRGGATKGGFERPSHKKRNASLSDIRADKKDDMLTEDDFEPEGGSDKEDAPSGVRFAEEVAIRFLSPVDHRYNESRRGRKRSAGRRGGRPGGVHSDDESGGRAARSEGRSPGYRGRGRGRGRATNMTPA